MCPHGAPQGGVCSRPWGGASALGGPVTPQEGAGVATEEAWDRQALSSMENTVKPEVFGKA